MSGAVNAARQVSANAQELKKNQQQSQPVQPKPPSSQAMYGRMGGRPAEASSIPGLVSKLQAPQPQSLPMKAANVFQGAPQPSMAQRVGNVFNRPQPQNVFQRGPVGVANVFQRQPVQQAQPSMASRVGGVFGAQQPQRPQPAAFQRVGALMSDEDEKETGGNSDARMKAFLDHVTNNTYVYKDPAKPGANDDVNDGPMAQDFEKSEIGRQFVHENDEGRKMLDANPRLTLVNTAAAAHLNERLKKLEKEDDED